MKTYNLKVMEYEKKKLRNWINVTEGDTEEKKRETVRIQVCENLYIPEGETIRKQKKN